MKTIYRFVFILCLLLSLSIGYTQGVCEGMDRSNMMHKISGDVLTLTWMPVDGDTVKIDLLDYDNGIYKNVGNVSMNDGKFDYKIERNGEYTFSFSNELNGCNDLIYKVDIFSKDIKISRPANPKSVCYGMNLSNVSHILYDDIVILTWTPVSGDIVNFNVFDSIKQEWKFLGTGNMQEGKYFYHNGGFGKINYLLTNECGDVYYKVDAGGTGLKNIKSNISCEGAISIDNMSHSVNNDMVTINWNDGHGENLRRMGYVEYAITGDFNDSKNIRIYLFNYNTNKYELIGTTNINNKKFSFKGEGVSKRNIRLLNGCNDVFYTADLGTVEQEVYMPSTELTAKIYENKIGNCQQIQGAGYYTGYSEEEGKAFIFAYTNGLTTINDIKKANMNGMITRAAMAKMLSYYAINILDKKPDYSKKISFVDVTNELDRQYNNGITLAYQLGIMGQGTNKFKPYSIVTRAEFATALSRLLYGINDETGNQKYYESHLLKLYNEGIINNNNPNLQEKRGYVMIMLMRSSNWTGCNNSNN